MRAWVLRKGSKAPQAAGTIHSDFERGFICAEVMAYNDLKELGSESEVVYTYMFYVYHVYIHEVMAYNDLKELGSESEVLYCTYFMHVMYMYIRA